MIQTKIYTTNLRPHIQQLHIRKMTPECIMLPKTFLYSLLEYTGSLDIKNLPFLVLGKTHSNNEIPVEDGKKINADPIGAERNKKRRLSNIRVSKNFRVTIFKTLQSRTAQSHHNILGIGIRKSPKRKEGEPSYSKIQKTRITQLNSHNFL